MSLPTFHFALREDLKDEKQFLPTRAEPLASGWDVRAAMPDRKPLTIYPFEYVKIPLGFRAFCPTNFWYELKPRSSTFAKKHLHSLIGTIDESFENEALFCATYIPHMDYSWVENIIIEAHLEECLRLAYKSWAQKNLQIEFGEAIGQIIPIRRQEMQVEEWDNDTYKQKTDLRNAVRRTGGFGSTDKQTQ